MEGDGLKIVAAFVERGIFANAMDLLLQHPEFEKINLDDGQHRYRFWRGGKDGQGNKVHYCWAYKWTLCDKVVCWKETVMGRKKFRRTRFVLADNDTNANHLCLRRSNR